MVLTHLAGVFRFAVLLRRTYVHCVLMLLDESHLAVLYLIILFLVIFSVASSRTCTEVALVESI